MITNVGQYFMNAAKAFPKRKALSDAEKSYTFSECNLIGENIAASIEKMSNGKNNMPIIVFLEKSCMEMLSFMGIIYSGNYYAPVDVKSPVSRLIKIFETLNADIIITEKKFDELLQNIGVNANIIYLDELSRNAANVNSSEYMHKIIDTDPAYVLFTSGSTGVPKGVVVSHRAVIDFVEWISERFDFGDNCVLGSQAPFYFDASMPDIYLPFKVGAELNIIPDTMFVFPNKMIDYINNKNINTLIWVPSALINMTSRDYFSKKRIIGLRMVVFCGELMPVKHMNIWKKYYPDVLFVNMYGPTEAAYGCSYYVVDRTFNDDETLPIGRACENTGLLILNDSSRRAGINEIGELCIRGSSLANGYFANGDKTKKAFVQNPLNDKYNDIIYRTGDLCYCNETGEIIFVGRKDNQIKHLGYRIELGEIEAAAYTIPEINRCCVLYAQQRDAIVLFCSLKEKMSEQDIYYLLKKMVPKYMLPTKIVVMDSLPENANGKIDRTLLKAQIYE